ncbi:MAG: 4Fe-4S dicluster domain-containing protein [Promethearchaeota archaeon]
MGNVKKIPDYNNPEHIITGIIEFDEQKCTRCGVCASLCPGRAIIVPSKKENGKRDLPYTEEVVPGITACMACGDCLAACPNKAIIIKRGFTVKKPYFYYRISQSPKFSYPKKY